MTENNTKLDLNLPETYIYMQREECIGTIQETKLIQWLKLVIQDSISDPIDIASSFVAEVLSTQNATLSPGEIVIFYRKLNYFSKDSGEATKIYQSLIFQDVIRFSLGPVNGKKLEIWLKKNSGDRFVSEISMIADSFVDEVLNSERAFLSIPEMEILINRMKEAFKSEIEQKVYEELRFREMLTFKSEA
jgi:hypothetical protein